MTDPKTASNAAKLAPLSITKRLERKEYYSMLRAQWAKAKQAAIEHPDSFEAIGMELNRLGLNYSPMSAWFTKLGMNYYNYDGMPYVDTKTYNGWKASGFKVIKGEHSKLSGLVWMHPKSKNSEGEEVEDSEYVYPKEYKLFHRSQVEAIGTPATKKTDIQTVQEVKSATINPNTGLHTSNTGLSVSTPGDSFADLLVR